MSTGSDHRPRSAAASPLGLILPLAVVLSIVVVIQYVVITDGTTRLSDVATEFAFDALSGRQAAIDADLNAGVISLETTRRMRSDLTCQAYFYAALDGAGKSVRGDVTGGIWIGISQYAMSPHRAVGVVSRLTIGDGLIVQLPGFLIGLPTTLRATRSLSSHHLLRDVMSQTIAEPAALYRASAVTIGLARTGGLALTGLPVVPMFGLGIGCAAPGKPSVTLLSLNQIPREATERAVGQIPLNSVKYLTPVHDGFALDRTSPWRDRHSCVLTLI